MIRELDPSRERNTNDHSPHHLWMLRGIEDQVKVSNTDLKRLLRSTPVVPIQEVLLPDPLKCHVFSIESCHLYFTTPESPNVIKAQYFPNPTNNPTAVHNNFKRLSRTYFLNKSFPKIEIDIDDIVALSVAGSKLFALTVKRGRTRQSTLWQIHRYNTSYDTGFLETNIDEVTDLDFESIPIEINEKVSFVVSGESKYGTNFYLSGIKGAHIYSGIFNPGKKVSPDALSPDLLSQYFESTSSIVLVEGYSGESIYSENELLVLERDSSKTYRIVHKEKKSRIFYLTPDLKNSPISKPSAMSYISINTSDLTINIQPYQQSRFYLIVSPLQKRVWTMSDIGVTLPLIGGGKKTELTFNKNLKPLNLTKEDDSNFLNLDIGDIDSICVVNNSFIIFGTQNRTGWKALLLPQMMNFLLNKPKNYSKENVRNKSRSVNSINDYDS
jgi:hypothetical protein